MLVLPHLSGIRMNWLKKVSGWYGSMGYMAYWIAPEGETFSTDETHHAWIHENVDMLDDEFGLNIRGWGEQFREESKMEGYEELRRDRIRDRAFEQGIDESQVVLTEKDEEELSEWADEGANWPNDVQLVDFLVRHGWLRIVNKGGRIYFEGDADSPQFWDRTEMAMINLFPEVWSNHNYRITINDKEIFSSDLQAASSLREAIEKSERRNQLALHWR